MGCIGVELPFEIDEHWAARREFIIGDSLLKPGVPFVDFGIERSRIEVFARHGELVDKREFEASQAFDLRVASRLTEGRSTAACNSNRYSANEHVSKNEILSNIRVHRAVSLGVDLALARFRLSRLEEPGFAPSNSTSKSARLS